MENVVNMLLEEIGRTVSAQVPVDDEYLKVYREFIDNFSKVAVTVKEDEIEDMVDIMFGVKTNAQGTYPVHTGFVDKRKFILSALTINEVLKSDTLLTEVKEALIAEVARIAVSKEFDIMRIDDAAFINIILLELTTALLRFM